MKRSQFVPAVNAKTIQFLSAMRHVGYRAVCVEIGHPIVPDSQTFVFGSYGSVFGHPNGKTKINGWPAIWHVMDDLGLSGGCGNSHQRQLISWKSDLERGAYLFRRGKWFRMRDAKPTRSRA